MMARPASQPSYAYVGTVASPPGPLAGAKAMQAIYNCSGKTDLIITYGGRWLPVALCRHVLRSLDARARRRAGPNRRTRWRTSPRARLLSGFGRTDGEATVPARDGGVGMCRSVDPPSAPWGRGVMVTAGRDARQPRPGMRAYRPTVRLAELLPPCAIHIARPEMHGVTRCVCVHAARGTHARSAPGSLPPQLPS